MKRILLFFSLCIGLSVLPKELYAQCTSDDAACNMAQGQFDNVVIGEVSGDAGQSDGANDAIVEIVGPPGTMIGCMVITDSEWAVLIPAGTVIPADGVFSIGCLTGMGTGVGITGGMNGLVAGGIGDFNAGLPIDFDVCDPANANYYDPAASGFTLDNTGAPGSLNGDGEQVFLFLPNGTPHDGIYWDGGGTGNADHASASMGMDYTLGDNDGNGTTNDVATTVAGKRGDGGNATAVPILPTGDGTECPCNTAAAPGTFTVPGIGGASDDNGMGGSLWTEIVGTDHVGCNSSFIRLIAGTSAGGADGSSNASHTDGEIENSTMDAMGQNLDNGGGATGGITSEGFDPSSFTPSACGDAAAEWAYTDHPTPGEANDDPTFVFFADQTVLCAPGMVTFTAEVYNWQHVEDMVTSVNQGNGKTGSYVIDETGAQVAWASITPSGGANETTTLTYTSGVLPVGTHTFTLVWDDWTDCCGTTGLSLVNECYESEMFTITVAEPLIATDMDIDCAAGDAVAGTINLSTFIMGGFNNTYDLLFNGVSQGTNMTGVFTLPTTAAMPITATVTDASGCTADINININDNCLAPPVCPSALDNTGTTANASVCPGDMVELCLDGTDLPAGGMICWYATTDGTDPITEDAATATATVGTTAMNVGCVDIPTAAPACGATIDFDNNTAGVTLTTSVATSTDGADDYFGILDNTMIDANFAGPITGNFFAFQDIDAAPTPGSPTADQATLTISGIDVSGCTGPVMVCLDIAEEDANDGNEDWDVGGSGGTDVFTVEYDVDGGGNTFGIGVAGQGGTNGAPAIDTNGDGTGNGAVITETPTNHCFTIPAGGSNVTLTLTMEANNGDEDLAFDNIVIGDGGGGGSAMIDCFMYTIPDVCDQSPATIRIEGLISPIDPLCTDAMFNYVGAESQFMVECPSAELVATAIDVCAADAPGGADLMVNLSGLAAGNYSLVYAIDGVAQPAISVAAPATMATINIPTPTTGEVKVTLVSVFNDADNSMAQEAGECSGTVMGDEVCVNIRPMSTIEITASANPTTCAPADGTFTISGPAGVLFDIEYTGGTLTGVTLPYTVMNLGPGTYEITSALDEGGCPVTINGAAAVLMAPGASSVAATDPAPICDMGGTGMIDLSTLAMLDGNGTDGGTLAYYGVDPRVVPGATPLGSSMVGATGTYYIEYNEGGCISYAEVNVTVNPDPVGSTDFVAAPCTGNGNTAVDVNIMVSGGSADYMISGLGITNQVQAADGTAVLTPTATTPSTVTIVDANGCMTTVDLSAYVADCLPVELTNFNGKLVGNTVELTWNTSSELNNSHFVLERSLDGAKFVELGKVQGAGTTVEPQAYNFTDAQPKQINYYRLKQVDFDGTYDYSIVIIVNTTGDDLGTKVFPVPTSETLVVETARLIDQVKVVDITGRVVLVQNVTATNRVELNVNALAAGAYFVAVQAERGVEMIRFVKQ